MPCLRNTLLVVRMGRDGLVLLIDFVKRPILERKGSPAVLQFSQIEQQTHRQQSPQIRAP